MSKTAAEIVALLGGTNATARFFNVKPPSVSVWLQNHLIPDDRLIPLAASIERKTEGAFNRREQWPERFTEIWPELTDDLEEAAHVHTVGAVSSSADTQGAAHG